VQISQSANWYTFCHSSPVIWNALPLSVLILLELPRLLTSATSTDRAFDSSCAWLCCALQIYTCIYVVYICMNIPVGLLLFIDKNVNMRLVGEATAYDETIWVGLEPCGRYRQEKWDSKQPSRPGVAQPARQRPGRTRSSCSLSFT